MSTIATLPRTQTIEPRRWNAFFAEFTTENRGAHAEIELLGGEVGHGIETEDRPFSGIAADVKDGARNVWITFASAPENHMTHGIQNVTAVRYLPGDAERGPVIEIQADDGTKTLLELGLRENYELPPGRK